MKYFFKVICLIFINMCSAYALNWSGTTDLSDANQNATTPQVAVDNSGNSIAIWSWSNGSKTIIQSSYSSDKGKTWSDPVNMSDTSNNGTFPQIAMDNSGHAVAVWVWYDGSNNIIQSSSSSDYGQTWSDPFDLTGTGRNASRPQIVMDNSGYAIAIWERSEIGGTRIESSYSDNYGVDWYDAVPISEAEENANYAQIAMDSSGHAVSVWVRSDGANDRIQASYTSDYGSTWSTPDTISVVGVDADVPIVTLNDLGHSIIIWTLYSGNNETQVAYSSDYGQNWSSGVTISTAGLEADRPDIAMDSSGNAIAIWEADSATTYRINVSYSSNHGATWSDPIIISEDGKNAFIAKITMANSGNVFAVFRRNYSGASYVIRTSYSTDYGHTWSSDTNLSSVLYNGDIPQVSMNTSGDVVYVWKITNVKTIIQTVYTEFPKSAPSASGKQDKISFMFQDELRNKITCDPISQSGTFKIYRDASLTQLILSSSLLTNEPFYLYEHSVKSNEVKNYYITWSNDLNNASPAEHVIIQ